MNFTLEKGQVAVLRTDTVYGLVAKAGDQEAVEKVYALKGRDNNKPCIILVASKEDIGKHGEKVEQTTKKHTEPTTVVVPKTTEPDWLTRGMNTVAYRIPSSEELRILLQKTGPLIAPSANPQGLPPARSVQEAKSYFSDQVDVYIDGGVVPENITPSRIVTLGEKEILR